MYVYGLFINSIHNGIAATFSLGGDAPVKLIEWNPFRNFAAIFTPTGLGVTFFLLAMLVLLDKRGKPYQFLSGYRFDKDRRGFDILPDGKVFGVTLLQLFKHQINGIFEVFIIFTHF